MKGKRCYKCNRWYPLFMFKKDNRKFQLPVALGKARNCRMCIWKDSSNGNTVVRWQSGTFNLVQLTFKQRLKELLNK
jgi:hypothetical protein